MKRLLVLVSMLFMSGVHAGLSSNFAVTTDYVWRGQTQTAHGAAVQGGMDYEHETGLSAGVWLSNVASLGTEVDFYGAYSHTFNDNISASLGGTFYHYTKSGTSDTVEANFGLNLWMVEFTANYIDDYFNSKSTSWYFTLGSSIDLISSMGLALSGKLGFTTFDDEVAVGSTDYLDYLVSLDRTMNEYTISVFYTNTNRKTKTATTEEDTEDHSFGVMASRSF